MVFDKELTYISGGNIDCYYKSGEEDTIEFNSDIEYNIDKLRSFKFENTYLKKEIDQMKVAETNYKSIIDNLVK